MKDFNDWVDKYGKKIEINIDEEKKKEMVSKYSKFVEKISPFGNMVKRVLDENGIIGPQRIFYYDYMREIYKATKKYKSVTLEKEIAIITNKWEMRGLRKEILTKIREEMLKSLFPE